METLVQDFRYAFRALLKNRAITLIGVITLAIGIGANTVVFIAINAFFLRPLPVRDGDRLITISERPPGTDEANQFSWPDYVDFKQQAGGISDILAYRIDMVGISQKGTPDRVFAAAVTGNYFSGLGIKPALGQFFSGDGIDRAGSEPVMVLSYNYWQSHFHGDPGIVGQQLDLDGHPMTVVGVAPEGFTGLYSILETPVFVPLGFSAVSDPKTDLWSNRGSRQLAAFGFLNPGTTLPQTQASLRVIASRLAEQYPDSDKGLSLEVHWEKMSRPQPAVGGRMFAAMASFLVLSLLVLLLACANIANLLLVRATVRRREMAVRAALGAGRFRIIRQVLTESILLAAMGGVAGILVADAAGYLLGQWRLGLTIPVRFDLSMDWRVLGFGCAIALLTGIFVGLTPALRISRTNVAEVLHDGGRGSSTGAGGNRVRNGLVVAQIAGSFVLLVIAGLFVRSLQNAQRVYLGFDPEHVANISMDPHLIGYDEARGREFYRELERRARALPGVQSASLATSVPLGYYNDDITVFPEGQPVDDKHPPLQIGVNSVGTSYFDTLQIPVLRGRVFSDADTEKSTAVAVINKAMADRLWPNQDAIGKRFRTNAGSPFVEVVGIVATGKYFGIGEDPRPFVYLSRAQRYSSLGTLQVRTAGDPGAMLPEMERTIHDLAPNLPLFDAETMDHAIGGANGFMLFQLGANCSLVLGLLGLTLALVGVYGVLSYVTAQRTQEIGIRMALGASRAEILKFVFRQASVVVGMGAVIGIVLSLAAARGISGMLVGVGASDPITLISVTAFLVGIALLASYVPARRATKVDPLVALRYE